MARRISGQEMEVFVDAIVAAYDQMSLTRMLRFRLDKRLDLYSTGPSFLDDVFKLVAAADMGGWWPRLLLAARNSNPENSALIEAEFKLLYAGVAVGGQGNLEKVVDLRSRFQDVRIFGKQYGLLECCVCTVEDNGGGLGTGWLVAPDIIITNYHVVQYFIKGEASPSGLRCRFDFKIVDGFVQQGRVMALAKEWCVAHQPYGPADLNAGRTDWKPDELDYALLRLAEPVGKQPIGAMPEPGAPARGWLTLMSNPSHAEVNDPLWLFQHPQDRNDLSVRRLLPMKIASGKVLEYVGGGVRLRHDARTIKGSSGSPCCNSELMPVALHHAGDPRDWPEGRGDYNQAIPVELIVADMKAHGVEAIWDKPP